MTSDQSSVTRTVFLFGSVGQGPYGYMSFGNDGRIKVYENSNEHSYSYEEGVLTFYDINGVMTSTLVESAADPLHFRPHTLGMHYLEPVLRLEPLQAKNSDKPAVVVNTLAKSGTYLVAEALISEGYRPLDLHLSSNFLHDNRGVGMNEIHWNPTERAVTCSASAVTSIIGPGEFVVGHIDSVEELRKIDRSHVELINVVRNPFDQIQSMLAFKIHKTKPKPSDVIWRSMDGLDRFKAFLLAHPVDYWLDFSRRITENFAFLKFEDLHDGRVLSQTLSPHLILDLETGLSSALGKRTSTNMGGLREAKEDYFKDESVALFLDALGVLAYAQTHWNISGPTAPKTGPKDTEKRLIG